MSHSFFFPLLQLVPWLKIFFCYWYLAGRVGHEISRHNRNRYLDFHGATMFTDVATQLFQRQLSATADMDFHSLKKRTKMSCSPKRS